MAEKGKGSKQRKKKEDKPEGQRKSQGGRSTGINITAPREAMAAFIVRFHYPAVRTVTRRMRLSAMAYSK